MVSGSYQGTDLTRIIDCYFTSHMELDKQKFMIKFMPPHDPETNGLPNVFAGERTETDMYIRTIPKLKYRDSIWVAPEFTTDGVKINYNNLGEAPRYLTLLKIASDLGDPNYSVIDKWLGIENGLTDATVFETAIGELNTSGIVSSADLDDYFFAPAEHRFYSVKVYADSSGQIAEGLKPIKPFFNTTPPFAGSIPNGYSFSEISISNVYSNYASNYSMYWAQCTNDPATNPCIQPYSSWPMEQRKTLSVFPGNPVEHSIVDLEKDNSYKICISAANKYGSSEDAANAEDKVECKTVFIPSDAAPLAGEPVLPNPIDNYLVGNTLQISGFNDANSVKYNVYWKSAAVDDTCSNGTDTLSTWNSSKNISPTGTAYISLENGFIDANCGENKAAWGDVDIKICGVNPDNVEGVNCYVRTVDSPVNESVTTTVTASYSQVVLSSSPATVDDNGDGLYTMTLRANLSSNVMFQFMNVPAGTVSYDLNVNFSSSRAELDEDRALVGILGVNAVVNKSVVDAAIGDNTCIIGDLTGGGSYAFPGDSVPITKVGRYYADHYIVDAKGVISSYLDDHKHWVYLFYDASVSGTVTFYNALGESTGVLPISVAPIGLGTVAP